ncbi:MAG: PsbP-related protein [Desulfobulbus sp.]|nr:PsbP-related protein [Desulfobulbus sp.]
MPSIRFVVRLCFFLVVSVVWAGVAPAAEKTARYSNNQYGFSFQYPASWHFAHTSIRNMRVKIVAPENGPAAECSVMVKEYPKAVKAKQSEIDQIFLEPPTVAELQEVLAQDSEQMKVTKAATGKLDKRPTHVARYRVRLGFDEYLSGQIAMTATPGRTWSVSCSGRGENQEQAEKNFQIWQQSIQALITSFQFKK